MNVVVEQGSKLNKSSFSPFYFPCMFPLAHDDNLEFDFSKYCGFLCQMYNGNE